MMKKLISAISAAALLLAAVPANASAVELPSAVIDGATVEYDITQLDNIVIRSVTGGSGELYIPETIDGYTVVEVADKAFYGNTDLTYVQLPETVIAVGQYAFAGCVELCQVTLSEYTEYLGEGAFMGCTSLFSAALGNDLTAIPDSCFSSCTKLCEVILSDTVAAIGDNAFLNCPELDNIIPPTITSIGQNALGMTVDSLTGAIVPVSGFLVAGTTGSAAEQYADSYGLDFIDLDNYLPGDVNDDGLLDSGDASSVLQEYARSSTGQPRSFSKKQFFVGDMNADMMIDSSDASDILKEYAKNSTT